MALGMLKSFDEFSDSAASQDDQEGVSMNDLVFSMKATTTQKDEIKKEKDTMALEEDVYCNLMLRLVEWQENGQIDDEKHRDFWTVTIPVLHASFLWLVNIMFQFLIICLVLLAAEGQECDLEEATFKKRYNQTRYAATQALLHSAASRNSTLPLWFDDQLQKVCGEQMVSAFLMVSPIMTLLWIMVMAGEIKSCTWWAMFISQQPAPEPEEFYDLDTEILVYTERDPSKPNQTKIIAMSPCLKLVSLVAVPGTRLMLVLLLTFAGTKFIFVQTNLANAVLKVVTLKFVITVDEMLMTAVSTKYGDRQLRNCKIYSPGTRTSCIWFPAIAKRWPTYGGMFWVLFSLTIWGVFFWLLLGGEYKFRSACLQYHEMFPESFGVVQKYSVLGALETVWE